MATSSNFVFVLSVYYTWLLQTITLGSVSPGLQIRLSQPGLNYASGVAVDILAKSVGQLKIPEQHGSASTPVGQVSYDATNIHVTNFNKPGSTVSINLGQGLTWQLSNAGISVNGNWHYQYRTGGYFNFNIQDSGTFDGDVTGASVSIWLTLGVDTTGRPTIASTGCQCSINSVKIRLSGGASWLYNLFMGYVESPIRSSLQTQICVSAQNAINSNARAELATLPVDFTIDNAWVFNYRLVSPPSFQSGFMESYHKGEFLFKGETAEMPFQPAAFPVFTSNRMVTILVSDDILNMMGYGYYKHDVLKYHLTKDDLSVENKGILNTSCTAITCFGFFIQQSSKAFPNATVELEMFATSYPNATTSSTGIQGNFAGIVDFKARLSNGSLVPMFQANASVVVNLTVSLTNMVLRGNFISLTPTIHVVETQIGPISDSVLNGVFNLAAKLFMIPKLKEVGLKGIPIPAIKDVAFTNTILESDNHYFRISTDVQKSA